MGVIAVSASDDHDHIRLLGEFNRSVLPLLAGWHTVSTKRTSDPGKRCMRLTRWRTFSIGCVVCAAIPKRARSDKPATSPLSTPPQIPKVASQAAHFNVVALADNHRVIAFLHQLRYRAMGKVHQGQVAWKPRCTLARA
jgi:hypothetical protein